MNKLNLPPFYVGQKVVCVKTHSQGIVVKGNVYSVKECYLSPCGCNYVVCVGVLATGQFNKCTTCGKRRNPESKYHPISHELFAPVQEAKPPLMTFTQIKEKEKEEILILN